MGEAHELAEEYAVSLGDLTMNSKPQISMLTMLAEDNIAIAPLIVQTIEKHLQKVSVDAKLPVLYLIDSILKNVKRDYTNLFMSNLVSMFCDVFKKVDEKTRSQMFKLRQTWSDVLPAIKLHELDCKVATIDPAWPVPPLPVSVTSNNRIHLNPKFLNSSTPSQSAPSPVKSTFSPTPIGSSPVVSMNSKATVLSEEALLKRKLEMELEHKKLELALLESRKANLQQKQATLAPETATKNEVAKFLVALRLEVEKLRRAKVGGPGEEAALRNALVQKRLAALEAHILKLEQSPSVNKAEVMAILSALRIGTSVPAVAKSVTEPTPSQEVLKAKIPPISSAPIPATAVKSQVTVVKPLTSPSQPARVAISPASPSLIKAVRDPRLRKRKEEELSETPSPTPPPTPVPVSVPTIETSPVTRSSVSSPLKTSVESPKSTPTESPTKKEKKSERSKDKEKRRKSKKSSKHESHPSSPSKQLDLLNNSMVEKYLADTIRKTYFSIKLAKKSEDFLRKLRSPDLERMTTWRLDRDLTGARGARLLQSEEDSCETESMPRMDVEAPLSKVIEDAITKSVAEMIAKPLQTSDVDLRVLPTSPSKKRSSDANGNEPPPKRSKAEIYNELFGSEDVDLRQLPTPQTPVTSVNLVGGGTAPTVAVFDSPITTSTASPQKPAPSPSPSSPATSKTLKASTAKPASPKLSSPKPASPKKESSSRSSRSKSKVSSKKSEKSSKKTKKSPSPPPSKTPSPPPPPIISANRDSPLKESTKENSRSWAKYKEKKPDKFKSPYRIPTKRFNPRQDLYDKSDQSDTSSIDSVIQHSSPLSYRAELDAAKETRSYLDNQHLSTNSYRSSYYTDPKSSSDNSLIGIGERRPKPQPEVKPEPGLDVKMEVKREPLKPPPIDEIDFNGPSDIFPGLEPAYSNEQAADGIDSPIPPPPRPPLLPPPQPPLHALQCIPPMQAPVHQPALMRPMAPLPPNRMMLEHQELRPRMMPEHQELRPRMMFEPRMMPNHPERPRMMMEHHERPRMMLDHPERPRMMMNHQERGRFPRPPHHPVRYPPGIGPRPGMFVHGRHPAPRLTSAFGPADPKLLEICAKDVMHTIPIDGLLREIRFYGQTAVTFVANDDPREIRFQEGFRNVVFNEEDSIQLKLNDEAVDFELDGKVHKIRLGAPTRELYIDGKGYALGWNTEPVGISIDGKNHRVQLEGDTPPVTICTEKRLDLCAGKINLVVDGEIMIPIYLDYKPQRFEIDGIPYVLQFKSALTRVIINDRVFKTDFGGNPKPLYFFGRRHFLRLSQLPEGIIPGEVQLYGMEEFRPPSPPVVPGAGPHSNSHLPNRLDDELPLSPSADRFESKHDQRYHRNRPKQGFHNKHHAHGGSYQIKGEIEKLSGPSDAMRSSDHVSKVGPTLDRRKQSKASLEEEQPPSASLFGKNINVNELFQKLIAIGIVGKSNNEVKKEDSNETAMKPVDFTKPETLKVRQTAMITKLYSGIQCSTCGLRFPPEFADKYSQHLDWHFRQNRRERDSARTVQSRQWYYDISDWIQFEEIEVLEERVQSWFESQVVDEEGREIPGELLSIPAGSDTAEGVCELCHDPFELFFHEETEEWHFRHAICVDKKLYHPVCHQDWMVSLELEAAEIARREQEEEENRKLEEKKKAELKAKEEEEEAEKEKKLKLEKEEANEEESGEKEEKEEKIEAEGEEPKVTVKQEPMEVTSEEGEAANVKEEPESEKTETIVEETPVETMETDELVSEEIVVADIEIKKEDLDLAAAVPDSQVDTTYTGVISSIDGNVELEGSSQVTKSSSNKIKINISKPVLSPSVVEEEAAAADETKPTTEEPESISEPSAVVIDPNEPFPPGLEPEEPIVKLKPRLVGRKLTEYPPVQKGTELSGLCSIM